MNIRFLSLLAAFSLISVASTSISSAADVETLHLAGSLVDGVTPVLYAQSAGLFKQAGLNVIIDKATNGNATAAAVLGGSIDIGESNIVPILTAHSRNLPLMIVAPASLYDPNSPDAALIVTTNSPLHNAHDMIGKIIGTPDLSDLSTLATQAWLEGEHVDTHSVHFVELKLPQMQGALDQSRVQAAVQMKPLLTDSVNSGKARILAPIYTAISPRFLESAWFATSDYVKAHRDALVRFRRVVAQASAYMNGHHTETAPLLASWTGIDPKLVAHFPRATVGTTLDARDIQPVIDVAAKYGLIAHSFPASEVMVP